MIATVILFASILSLRYLAVLIRPRHLLLVLREPTQDTKRCAAFLDYLFWCPLTFPFALIWRYCRVKLPYTPLERAAMIGLTFLLAGQSWPRAWRGDETEAEVADA